MKRAFFIVGLLTMVSCQDVKKPEPPDNLISKDKMVEILSDAYIGNAAKSINNRMLRTKGVYLDSVLYKKFGIDSLQFAQSNAYYTTDLNTYADILTKVEEALVVKKVLADSLHNIEKEEVMRKKDSVRKRDSLRVNGTKGQLSDPIQDLEE
ncbi:MAG: hypothetical protein Aureis2KO_03410 [Aureisphaera sp.]